MKSLVVVRGYSLVERCEGFFACSKVESHYHVYNYSSESAVRPFSQSGPFTCGDDAFEQINKEESCASVQQQMDAVVNAMAKNTLPLMEDEIDRVFNPDNGLMQVEELRHFAFGDTESATTTIALETAAIAELQDEGSAITMEVDLPPGIDDVDETAAESGDFEYDPTLLDPLRRLQITDQGVMRD